MTSKIAIFQLLKFKENMPGDFLESEDMHEMIGSELRML